MPPRLAAGQQRVLGRFRPEGSGFSKVSCFGYERTQCLKVHLWPFECSCLLLLPNGHELYLIDISCFNPDTVSQEVPAMLDPAMSACQQDAVYAIPLFPRCEGRFDAFVRRDGSRSGGSCQTFMSKRPQLAGTTMIDDMRD